MKFLALLLLFFGEVAAIAAEMLAARGHAIASEPLQFLFARTFALMVIGGALLVGGYMTPVTGPFATSGS